MLFLRWTDQTHTTAVVDEESHTGTVAHEDSVTLAYLVAHHYIPYRYKGVTEGAHDTSGDGHGDLLVVKSDHTLWELPGTGYSSSLKPVELFAGAGEFVQTTVVDNWFGATFPAVLATKTNGTLWAYPLDGSGRLGAGRQISSGWGNLNSLLAVGDMNHDGHPDIAARDKSGKLWVYRGNGSGGFLAGRVLAGSGFGSTTTRLIGATDWNGDHVGDVLLIRPDGRLWFSAGTGTGRVSGARPIGSGWKGYSAVAVAGDWTSDFVNDLVAVSSTGAVVVYPGNNRGGVLSRRTVATGLTSVVRSF